MTDSGSSRPSSGPAGARPRSRLAVELSRPASVGFGAFVVGAALAAGLAWFVGQSWQDAVGARFARRAGNVTANLHRELLASGAMLNGARGLLQLTPGIAPDAWRAYVASLDLANARAPLRGLGYARLDASPARQGPASAIVATPAQGPAAILPGSAADTARAPSMFGAPASSAAAVKPP
ncbi:histidine kinase, partial [Burkholderia sp. Cy-637]|nr:histidine kinase [Burkholderia sp. Cy-637]